MAPPKPPGLTVLTPAARPRRRFPWQALAGILAAAAGTAVLVLRPGPLNAPFDVALKVIAVVSACVLASWLEERIFAAVAGRARLLRLLVAGAVPALALPGAFAATGVVRPWMERFGEHATSALGVFAFLSWLGSAGVGTLVVVAMDFAISSVVRDLRSRITLAVLVLLALVSAGTFLLTWAIPALAARVAQDPTGWAARFGATALRPDEIRQLVRLHEQVSVLEPEVQKLLHVPEGYRVLRSEEVDQLLGAPMRSSGPFTFVLFALALLFGLPAILSACAKLADAVMERLHPLGRAFHLVSRGQLDVRVEEGGSQDFVALNRHFNKMVESLSQAQRMERAFGLYVGEHVRERIQSQHGEAEIPASLREATVFFADIRGFTSLSERLAPSAVLEVLNRYFERVVPVVEQYEGYLDKFVGDAMMVVFNGPIDQPDHADRAVQCAIALQEEMVRLSKIGEFAEVGELKIGIGIATGPLVAGNLGSARKMEYTVVGDTVNLASRLTSHAGPGEVWVSEGCAEALPRDVPRVALGPLAVKGKAQPVRPFQVWPVEADTEKVDAAG